MRCVPSQAFVAATLVRILCIALSVAQVLRRALVDVINAEQRLSPRLLATCCTALLVFCDSTFLPPLDGVFGHVTENGVLECFQENGSCHLWGCH